MEKIYVVLKDDCQGNVTAIRAFSDEHIAERYSSNKEEANPYHLYYINEVKLD